MSIQSIREILDGKEFLAISPHMTLETASDLLQEHRVSAAPVLSDGALVGILGERDILRHVSQRGGFATAEVAEAMTRRVVSIQTRDSIVDAVARMQSGGYRQLPVLDIGGKVVGLLSIDDIPFEFRTMRASYVAWRGAVAAE